MSRNKQTPSEQSDPRQHGDEACSVLVIGAAGAYGQAICRAFARPGARIAMQYGHEEDAVWETAAWVASRGGIALPLCVGLEEWVPHEGEADAVRRLVERVVEDFGRLDIVVVAARAPAQEDTGSDDGGARGEGCSVLSPQSSVLSGGLARGEGWAALVASLARAAGPFLRKSRPLGHLIVLAGGGPASPALDKPDPLVERVETIAREWKACRSRARITMVPLEGPGSQTCHGAAPQDSRRTLTPPDEAAQLVMLQVSR
jgi:NAD(P)-dependent dehydrogenase (short-subunit alcohol dehydrogenase family)